MGSKSGKQYSPKFKFAVVLEVLKGEKSEAEIARAFEVHPATVSRWRKQFLDKGPELFGGSEEVKEYQERIGQLERMLGKKSRSGRVPSGGGPPIRFVRPSSTRGKTLRGPTPGRFWPGLPSSTSGGLRIP